MGGGQHPSLPESCSASADIQEATVPNFKDILSLYQARERVACSGALSDEAQAATMPEFDAVARGFLTRREQRQLDILPPAARQARLRIGVLRFAHWEAMNGDIAALLRRKAEA